MSARYLHEIFTHMCITPFVHNFRVHFLIYSHKKTVLEDRQGRDFMLFLLMKRQSRCKVTWLVNWYLATEDVWTFKREPAEGNVPPQESQPQLYGLGVGGPVWGKPPGPGRSSHAGRQAGWWTRPGAHARWRGASRGLRRAGRRARRWVALLGRPAPDLLRPGRKSSRFRVKGRSGLSARPCRPRQCISLGAPKAPS